MSEQQPEEKKEPPKVETTELKPELIKDPPGIDKTEVAPANLLIEQQPGQDKVPLLVDKYEQEWIPGEQLELIRIPPPTIWPATVALGITGIAFGVVTHWILSLAGLFLFVLGAAGWIEDLKKDVL